jgi:hypothetical protein
MTQIEQPTRKLPPNDTYRILTLENRDDIEKLKEACKQAGHEVVPVHRFPTDARGTAAAASDSKERAGRRLRVP